MMDFADVDKAIFDAEREVAAAGRKLAALRALRDDLQPFVERYRSLVIEGAPAACVDGDSLLGSVLGIFQEHPDAVFDVNDVVDAFKAKGIEAAYGQIRNSIYYARRLGLVHTVRRGRFILATQQDAPNPREVTDERRPHDQSE